MKNPVLLALRRAVSAIGLTSLFTAGTAVAWEPLRAHPNNSSIFEFREEATVLHTFAEHYGSAINTSFDFLPYLDVLQRDEMNLTRVFLMGFRLEGNGPSPDPLNPSAADFLQPWPRSTSEGLALDGLGKWDLSKWDETYFTRLKAFAGACSDREIVAALTFFCTFYNQAQWDLSPFNPANNVQGIGPENRYDSMRGTNLQLLAVQEAAVKRIVKEVNEFDNVYFEIQNEPFWNDPQVGDAQEIAFHQRMLEVIREEELGKNRHLVAHNFIQHTATLTGGFDILNEHYPKPLPGAGVAGGEALLQNHSESGLILALDETLTDRPDQTRVEAWMFLIGGGAVYNGLDFKQFVYSPGSEDGDNETGITHRKAVRSIGTYLNSLHRTSLHRDLTWIAGGVPTGATIQAMGSSGQQYVAYIHHGQHNDEWQLTYDPIYDENHTVSPVVELASGNWRAIWTRPEDLAELGVEEFSHTGGEYTLAPVTYQQDVALRIERVGEGDLTPPPTPSGLAAAANPDGSVTLTWQAPHSNDFASTQIYRSESLPVPIDEAHRVGSTPTAGGDFTDVNCIAGHLYRYVVAAVDLNGNQSAPSRSAQALSEKHSLPYGGTAPTLPGKIQAENFDTGGEGVAYHDLTLTNTNGVYRATESVDIDPAGEDNAYQIVQTEADEWLNYTIHVDQGGEFELQLRAANNATGGSVYFEIDGVKATGNLPIPDTGGAENFQTLSFPNLTLSAGSHVLTLVIATSATNGSAGGIDWFVFTAAPKLSPTANAGPDQQVIDSDSDGIHPLTLSAAASVPGATALTSFAWSENGVPLANGVSASINLAIGEHLITLLVTDSAGLQDTDEIMVTVSQTGFVNGSFENGFAGWIAKGNVGIQSTSPYAPTEGSKLAAFNSNESSPNGLLTQTFPTIPGQTYLVAFDAGVLSFNSFQQSLKVEIVGTSTQLSQIYVLPGPGGGKTQWLTKNASFVADSTATTISFADHSAVTASLDLVLDHISIKHQITRALTVETDPVLAANVMVDPQDNLAQTTGITPFTRFYQDGTSVTLTTPATTGGYRFQKWLKDGIDSGTNPSVTVTLGADQKMTAVYAQAEPVITSQPASVTTGLGSSHTFEVIAEGAGPFTYQWSHNGASISGANTSSYVIPNIAENHAGKYFVVVSNAAGSTVSEAAELSVVTTTLINGSFESGFLGWTTTGNQVIQSSAPYTSTNGSKLVAFNSGESTPNAVLSQSFATTPGTPYLLSFDFGVLAFNSLAQQLQVEVKGSSILALQDFSTMRLGTAITRWDSKSISFTANSTSTTLTFRDKSSATSSLDLTLDNVQISSLLTHKLTVESSPSAVGSVQVDISPADNSGNGDGTTNFTRTYLNATVVNLTAPTQTNNHQFIKWLKDGTDFSTNPGISVTLGTDTTLTAVYAIIPPTLPSGLQIMPLGDSITYGYNGNNAGYRGPLYQLLSPIAANFKFVGTSIERQGSLPTEPIDQRHHQGHSSYTIQDISNNLDGLDNTTFLNYGGADRDHHGGYWLTGGNGTGRDPLFPDLITLMIGTNDLSNLAGADTRLINLITKITTLRPAAKLFVAKITPWPTNASVAPYNEIVTQVVTDFQTAEKNVHLVDLNTDFPSNGLDPDGLHPNSIGFEWMAARWYDAIISAGANNSPPIAAADSYIVKKDTPLVVAPPGILANDSDTESGNLTAILDSLPAHGSLALNPNGSFTYTPASGQTGADSFTYHASDGTLSSNTATVNLTVTSDAGLLNGSFESGFAEWTTTGNLAIQSTAPYSATDGLQIVSFNSHDSTPNAVLSQTFATVPGVSYKLTFDVGNLSYNTNAQTILVTATGSGVILSKSISIPGLGGGSNNWLPQSHLFIANSTSTTLTFQDKSTSTNSLDLLLDKVVVTSDTENTAPAATADSYTAQQNTTLVIPAAGVLANDSDPQSNPLTAVLDTAPVHGSVSLNPNGGFAYTPASGYTGLDSFSYHASDGALNSDSVNVEITVAIATTPILINGSFESGFQGWTTSGNQGVYSTPPYAPVDGANLAAFNGGNLTPNGILFQSFPTLPGVSYTLTFHAGVLSYNTNNQTVLVTVTGVGTLLSQSVTISGQGGGSNHWLPQSFTFTSNSNSATLTFQDKSTSTNSLDLLLDHIQVITTAPTAQQHQMLAAEKSVGKASLEIKPNRTAIKLAASQPGLYVLEYSTDLQDWKILSEMKVTEPGPIEFQDSRIHTAEKPPRACFYRIGVR
jgi:VCBS repeat-containing protein